MLIEQENYEKEFSTYWKYISFHLFQFLKIINPEVALKYQVERWHKNLTGSSYNCPEPPKNIKREYYQRKEKELKERNKREYERKQGLLETP